MVSAADNFGKKPLTKNVNGFLGNGDGFFGVNHILHFSKL